MKKSQKLSWNDFLFENRNKAFGAYQIRINENWNLLKSLLITLGFFGILALILSFTTKETEVVAPPEPKPIEHHFTKIEDEFKIEKPKVVVPKVAPAAKAKKLDSKVMPDPKNNPDKETPITKNTDIGKTLATDEDGTQGTGNVKVPVVNSGGDDGFAQPNVVVPVENKKIYSPREVTKMAIFPGCENVAKDKVSLQNCMSKELQKELGVQLNDFAEIADKFGISLAKTKLQFTVNQLGNITHIKAMNGNEKQFDAEAQKALEQISKRLTQKGKFIQPAEMDDGSKVNMTFTIPVQFLMN